MLWLNLTMANSTLVKQLEHQKAVRQFNFGQISCWAGLGGAGAVSGQTHLET